MNLAIFSCVIDASEFSWMREKDPFSPGALILSESTRFTYSHFCPYNSTSFQLG